MSKLSAFLNPVNIQEEREVIISDRFKDDKGNPVAFKIRAMSQAENDQNVKLCTKKRRVGNQTEEYFDNIEFSRRTIVEATVEPDFRAKELCDAYGVLDPLLEAELSVVWKKDRVFSPAAALFLERMRQAFP